MTTIKLEKQEIEYLQEILREHTIEFSDAREADNGEYEISIAVHSPQIMARLFIMVGMKKMGSELIEATAKWNANSNNVVKDVINELTK